MLDVIHPSANDIVLIAYRGAPVSEADWSLLRRSATTLTESGRLLVAPERRRDRNDWLKYANEMARVGEAAFAAAQAKDLKALRGVTAALDASCTDCHRRYRPNVFASEGESR